MSELLGFLYARPSFLGGMARALDIGGTLQEYNRSRSAAEADATALNVDYHTALRDLETAVDTVLKERAISSNG